MPMTLSLGSAVVLQSKQTNKQTKKTFDRRYPQNFAQLKKFLDKEVVERLVCHEY
jgi:hypothetical protein